MNTSSLFSPLSTGYQKRSSSLFKKENRSSSVTAIQSKSAGKRLSQNNSYVIKSLKQKKEANIPSTTAFDNADICDIDK